MSRHLDVLLTAALVGLAGCAPKDAPMDRAAELASLVAADALYSASTDDLEGVMALYAPDAIMYAPETAPISGLEGVRAMMEAFMADPAAEASFTPLYAEVSVDGDMGYTMNLAELTQTGPDGDIVTELLRDFHVWRKQPDGSWRIVVDIWNAAPPPPMQ